MIIIIGNLKGGSGKSFVAASLALAYSDMGRRVLLVDADIQNTSTRLVLGAEPEEAPEENIFLEPVDYGGINVTTINPAMELSKIPFEDPAKLLSAFRDVFMTHLLYDVVIVDTPASFYPYTYIALLAARRTTNNVAVLYPVSRAPWTHIGAQRFYRATVKRNVYIQKRMLLINNVYKRDLKQARDLAARTASTIQAATLETWIPRRVNVEDATLGYVEGRSFERVLRSNIDVWESVKKAAAEILSKIHS